MILFRMSPKTPKNLQFECIFDIVYIYLLFFIILEASALLANYYVVTLCTLLHTYYEWRRSGRIVKRLFAAVAIACEEHNLLERQNLGYKC